jgi:hypothetical protein
MGEYNDRITYNMKPFPDSIDFSLISGDWMISPRCPASILPPAWSGSPKELKSSQNMAYFISMSNVASII